MADLTELMQQLSEHEASDVAKALQSSAHGVWQEVWNAGHANATKRAKDDLESKEAELKAEREAKAKLEARVEAMKQQQPDTAKIREQYDAEINELREKHEAEKQALVADRAQSETRRARSDFKARLVSMGVDSDWAEVQAEKLANRFKYQDGELQILQAGKDIPITPGEGKTAIELLAEETRKAAPPKFVASSADQGSNVRDNGKASGAQKWEKYRLSAEEKQAGKAGDLAAELDRRTGRPTG